MTRTVEIKCDACGNDLATTGNRFDYRLALVNENIPISRGAGAVTSMAVYPAIDHNTHFCGINCLRDWLDKNYPAGKIYHGGKAWAEHQRKKRAAAESQSPDERLDQALRCIIPGTGI